MAKIERAKSEELYNILGDEFPVLDKGFVRVIDYMGNDSSIVQAARVSYGEGTKTVNDDKGLINYLLKHSHSTPFEMCEIKLHVKLPIFIARQWMRHRSFSYNEVSARYSEVKEDDYYLPENDRLRSQSKSNKQCSGEVINKNEINLVQSMIDFDCSSNFEDYSSLINDHSLARETARIVLPLSMYTEFYCKVDLHNLIHFLRLRDHPHAQYEIREYAKVITDIVKLWCPHAYEAYIEYKKGAKTLSKTTLELAPKIFNKQMTLEEAKEILPKRDFLDLDNLVNTC